MKFHIWAATTLIILVAYGIVYQGEAERVDERVGQMQPLRRPLAQIPIKTGMWEGAEKRLDPHIEKVAGADEYILRIYKNAEIGRSLQFYVTYNGRPRTLLGHRPDICFPSQGWQSVFMQSNVIKLKGGTVIPVMVHAYQREGFTQMVINYYNVSGRLGNNPNIAMKMGHESLSRKHFVSQTILYLPVSDVQSALELATLFLNRFHQESVACFPDTSGEVEAEQE